MRTDREGLALIFAGNGDGRFGLSDDAASSPVSYVFPRIRWNRRGDAYVLRFSETSLQSARSAAARLEGTALLIGNESEPYVRSTADACGR